MKKLPKIQKMQKIVSCFKCGEITGLEILDMNDPKLKIGYCCEGFSIRRGGLNQETLFVTVNVTCDDCRILDLHIDSTFPTKK